ncbi:Methyltransferase type 11 [Gemmatirosa kalamazoonensis]|uniref:Methyltransferase type 11 n=1 Tax=Gemmatirosa kalamazoonensis TaxID=861299 RepID=W0RJR4_9BACT|nr:class I SAM-dependent methyltransferase [Gemmatirosa kalamazoonensis]AHG91319.1 Methyltransferase type 11 [Gemmatirosa kalamazoonensis]
MIEHAMRIERDAPLGIAYTVADAQTLDRTFAPASFDVATSCLALQDVPDPERALRAMHTVLRPGGRAVVSIAHPCSDTPYREWLKDAGGRKLALSIDRYFERTVMRYRWTGWSYEFTTPAVHAPLEDWFRWILGAGFALCTFAEPRPSAEALREHPDLEDAARVPYFAMFGLARS